jgi:Fur family peroxide stress response transcriptional regulator
MKTLRQTSQRKAIMQYLEGNKDHPTVKDIYRAVKATNPTISLATVYNTVNALKREGLVSEVPVGANRLRYDSNMKRHHHFICLSCNKIQDIEEPIGISIPEHLQGSFHILSEKVQLYGYCHTCRSVPPKMH